MLLSLSRRQQERVGLDSPVFLPYVLSFRAHDNRTLASFGPRLRLAKPVNFIS